MAMDQTDVKALRPDALGPAEIEAKAETLAVGKAGMAGAKCFVLAIRRRVHRVRRNVFPGVPGRLGRAVRRSAPESAASASAWAWYSCCAAELRLFTGNMLMVTGLASKKIKLGGLVRNWAIVWLGNLVGSLIVVALIYWCGVGAMNGGAVGDAHGVGGRRQGHPDWLVCSWPRASCATSWCAWQCGSASPRAPWWTRYLESCPHHRGCRRFRDCVANMFFLPTGLLMKSAGFGAAVANAGALDVTAILYNLSAATVGNSIGGVLVGLAYWFVYARNKAK